MSNEMFQGETQFKIEPSQEEAARLAMINLAKCHLDEQGSRASNVKGQEEEMRLPIEEFTLDEIVEAFGWEIHRTDDGSPNEICGIDLQDDFSSDEDQLFEVLCPFVVPGNYITLSGKGPGGAYWEKRYGFTGKRVIELEQVYPPVPIDL